MSSKFLLYLVITPLVIYGMSSLNINNIFKKNRVVSAHVFMYLIGAALIYLVTNCIYDIFLYSI